MSSQSSLIRYLWMDYRPSAVLVGCIAVLGAAAQTTSLLLLCITANDILIVDGDNWRDEILARSIYFAVAFSLAVGLKTYALKLWTRLTEQVIAELVLSITKKIAAAGLRRIEMIGEQTILARLTADTKTVSSSFWSLLAATQTLTMLICALTALLAFAFEESLIISGATAINFFVIYKLSQRAKPVAEASYRADDRFQTRLRDLIIGFQDLRMDPNKEAQYISKGIKPAANAYRKLRFIFSDSLSLQISFFFLYLMSTIGFVLFIGPEIGFDLNVFLIVGVFFYLLDRIELLSAQIPSISLGNMALGRIEGLRHSLPEDDDTIYPEISEFKTISLRDVTYKYRDSDDQVLFTLGPIDLELQAGQIYLIQGGNGSGKSSLMKVLTGLYRPDDGDILLDGQRVKIEIYRSLFTTVFTDFYLFKSLYGIEDHDEGVASELLDELEMGGKVAIRDGAFSRTNFSTGQKKRLALTAAYLERRPVIVLDEWTADQDPEFRHFFFAELLPRLKGQGFTVFAVTHDDKYFNYCDYSIRVENGRISTFVERDPKGAS